MENTYKNFNGFLNRNKEHKGYQIVQGFILFRIFKQFSVSTF